jgi:hypothetical protein
MNKILTFLLIIFFIAINMNITYSIKNADYKRITYLIKYVNTKIVDLGKITKKYNLENDRKINSRIKKLKDIKKILIKIEKT